VDPGCHSAPTAPAAAAPASGSPPCTTGVESMSSRPTIYFDGLLDSRGRTCRRGADATLTPAALRAALRRRPPRPPKEADAEALPLIGCRVSAAARRSADTRGAGAVPTVFLGLGVANTGGLASLNRASTSRLTPSSRSAFTADVASAWSLAIRRCLLAVVSSAGGAMGAIRAEALLD